MRALNIADVRAGDIDRTAEELRAAFLLQHNKDASRKQQILNSALVDPTVTDAEYRVMSLELKFAKNDGTNCTLKPENGAKLLGRSLDSYERAVKGLAEGRINKGTSARESLGGWCDRIRRWNKTTRRDYATSPHTLRVAETAEALFNILEQETETAEMRIESSETANLRECFRKNAALTPCFELQKKKEYGQPAGNAPPKGGRPKKAVMPLPDGWQPNATAIAFISGPKVRATAANIDFELERFRNHAKQQAREAADWDAAFRNWMLSWRKREDEKPSNGQMNGYRGGRL